MKKTFFFKVFLSLFSLLTVISLLACSTQEADEAARNSMIKTLDQLFEEKITFEKATEKIESLVIPDDTAFGYAMTKYKQNILSYLELQKTDPLVNIRNLLMTFHENKESDVYYKAFLEQEKTNDNLRDYTVFMNDFRSKMSAHPNYEITEISKETLDLGASVYSYEIKCTQFEDSFSLSIETTKDNKITQAKLSRSLKKNGSGNFPAFSSYVYLCMGFEFENNDSEAFYQKYDLNSQENIQQSFTEGEYQIKCMTMNLYNKVIFSITANEQ